MISINLKSRGTIALLPFSLRAVLKTRTQGRRHYRKESALSGWSTNLLRCSLCGCCVSAEIHKGRYVYYRCSFGHGKCSLPYMPQPKLSEALGILLENILIPEEVVVTIADSIQSDRSGMAMKRERELSSLNQRLSLTRTLMDKSYEEKLLGKVDESVYERKAHQWREDEMRLKTAVEAISAAPAAEDVLSARRILELAQNAHSVYLTANDAERARLLKTVLSNCSTDGVSLWPTYRKPFDTIFECVKNEEWRRGRDSNPRYRC